MHRHSASSRLFAVVDDPVTLYVFVAVVSAVRSPVAFSAGEFGEVDGWHSEMMSVVVMQTVAKVGVNGVMVGGAVGGGRSFMQEFRMAFGKPREKRVEEEERGEEQEYGTPRAPPRIGPSVIGDPHSLHRPSLLVEIHPDVPL